MRLAENDKKQIVRLTCLSPAEKFAPSSCTSESSLNFSKRDRTSAECSGRAARWHRRRASLSSASVLSPFGSRLIRTEPFHRKGSCKEDIVSVALKTKREKGEAYLRYDTQLGSQSVQIELS